MHARRYKGVWEARESLHLTDLVASRALRVKGLIEELPVRKTMPEDLDSLVATVLERHPRRDRALDRLLSDMEALKISDQQLRFDMSVDSDWDGLG